MTDTVTIYTISTDNAFRADETGRKYSLHPASPNTIYYSDDDDDGVAYALPDGVSIAGSETGPSLPPLKRMKR